MRTGIKWDVCYDARRSRCKGNLPGDASSLAGAWADWGRGGHGEANLVSGGGKSCCNDKDIP
ncbi:hypothetical protein D3C86_1797460 [compost metagenome]